MAEVTELLNLLVVTITDMRASADAQRRTVGHIQTIIEHYRFSPQVESLAELQSKMSQLQADAQSMNDSIAEATRVLGDVIAHSAPSTESGV